MIFQPPRCTDVFSWVLPFMLAFGATEVSVAAPVTTSLPAVADTTLRQQQANQNRGGDEQVRLGWAQTSRTLVRFDPAAITAAVGTGTLISAHLELDVEETGESWPGGSQNVGAHRVTATWTETGATWNCAIDAQPADNRADCNPLWNGGSFLAAATATVPHTKETRGLVRFDVTADVAAFLAGAENHGWLLKKEDEALSGRIDYVSREGMVVEGRPRLVVVVEPRGEDTAPPVVEIVSPAAGNFARVPTVRVVGTVSDDGVVASVTVNGAEVPFSGGRFETDVALAEGVNGIVVIAIDSTGKHGAGSVSVILDTIPPVLTLEVPASGQLTNQPEIRVTGDAADERGIASLQVNGLPAPVTAGRFEVLVPVAEGPNTILVRAVDLAGNPRELSVEVARFTLPVVTITSPADLGTIAATTVDVAGSVSDSAATVTVNGVQAVVSGGSFFAKDIPLIEGGNILTATASSTAGRVGSDSINVVRDLTPPRVTIESPRDGSEVFTTSVLVSGMVNDIVAGTVNATEATVTVNGHLAVVANRSFLVEVPLIPGENLLTAKAVDESGNTGQVTARVRLDPPTVPRIAILSGDGQTATIGSALPQPLVVALYDAGGLPVLGRPVVFKVRGGNGSLDGGKRQIAVTTDGSGRAVAHFKLGSRSGAGNQTVEASAVGFSGPAVFRVTALPDAPAALLVDAGNQQVGIAGQALPQPLVATVTDSGFNRLEGVAVRFKIVKGQGRFENDLLELVVHSDSDGRAIAPFFLDSEDGVVNNIVEARIEGLDDSPVATFFASGRAAGEAAQTAVSGIILDNTNQPIQGVSVRILGTSFLAQSDGQGFFRVSGAPVGTIKLIIDGSTADRPGSWPDLEFVLTTISGRDNTIGMPIYLLPLDLQHGVSVDETRGGTLTLPEVPGFSLEILPGSVTFPGGSRSGVVSVTAVHSDKVPMVPNFGQQPRFIVTIQPAGARFDPPARLTLPNVEGLAPGEVTELYSFDHDLGHFVSIGPGTVSEDGTIITSNSGVGILKAGWHCGGNPAAAGTPADCPECTICDGSQCVEGCSLSQGSFPNEPSDIESIFAPARRCLCGKDANKVCSGKKCECAVPVNLKLKKPGENKGCGTLYFEYTWESSTGNLFDLSDCVIFEQVLYPGWDPNGPDIQYYHWPAPWFGATPNPTVSEKKVPGYKGFLTDEHEPHPHPNPKPPADPTTAGGFRDTFNEESFIATQRYVYMCPCANGGRIVELYAKNPIERSVVLEDGKYKYVVTKDGASAEIRLPLPCNPFPPGE